MIIRSESLPSTKPTPAQREVLSGLRVALIHYWFVRRRGGERVVEALAELFPQADLFAVVADPSVLGSSLRRLPLHVSALNHLPGSIRWHRHLLPLYPLALEQFDLRGYDLVISSESGPAKGVITSPRTCHICYCHSPMRYIWDLYHSYRPRMNLLARSTFTAVAHYLRMWDLASAARVDQFVANSEFVARRISKYYGRQATVIYPPVNVRGGRLPQATGDHYLVVSPLVGYKRVDLAIDACNRLGRKLRIVGDGEEYKRLRRQSGSNIEWLGWLTDEQVAEEYLQSRALLFPAEEDFGLVPVEAQAYGRPVIAYGAGGALETVAGFFADEPPDPETSTGVLFRHQSVDSLAAAMITFEKLESGFQPSFIRTQALRFDADNFRRDMYDFIADRLSRFVYRADARLES